MCLTGPSTWGKKVGRKWEQQQTKNKTTDGNPSAGDEQHGRTEEMAPLLVAAPVMDGDLLVNTAGEDVLLAAPGQVDNNTLMETSGPTAAAPAAATTTATTIVGRKKHARHRPAANSSKSDGMKRKVSRVESLRNLFLRPSHRPSRPASPVTMEPVQPMKTAEPVPKVMIDAPDVIQEAQQRSLSLEDVSASSSPSTVESGPDVMMTVGDSKKSHFPHSFIRSRRPLLMLPTLVGSNSTDNTSPKSSSASCDDLTDSSAEQPQHVRYRSVVNVSDDGGRDDFKLVRRKRSFSLATLPVSASEAAQQQTSARSEESGYESDSTRHGSESPRRISPPADSPNSIHVSFVSSLPAKLEDDEEHVKNRTDEEKLSLDDNSSLDILPSESGKQKMDRCCNCRCKSQPDGIDSLTVNQRPNSWMGQTRQGRHLPVITEATLAGSRYVRSSSLDRKKFQNPSILMEIGSLGTETLLLDQPDSIKTTAAESLVQLRTTCPASLPPTRPASAQPRQFKMLRLVKGETGELGIYIKKKPSPDSGSVGYVIAGIEPGALAHRYSKECGPWQHSSCKTNYNLLL